MHKVLILGSGNIGLTVALLLKQDAKYSITLVSRNKPLLESIKKNYNITTKLANLDKIQENTKLFKGYDTVISALPFYLNSKVAKIALELGLNYFDFTEDVKTTNDIKKLAKRAKKGQVFIPQCGLAPGFISILAHELFKQFDEVYSLKMRVGALPINPSNKILYNLTWSTDGLINEYCNEGFAIKDSKLIKTQPLEGLEIFSLDGLEYEAFNTSGGLGTLCDSLLGSIKELNYKTIRYQGHQKYMDFLIHDLHLGKKKKRDTLKEILEYAIPTTNEDVVLIFCSASGLINGKLQQNTEVKKIYNQKVLNKHLSSIQITTASGLCTVLDLFVERKIKATGFVKQEDIEYKAFIKNQFAKVFKG